MEHGTILCGFGGQGLLFAGQVLAQAALLEGREVSWMPSYGPEMRGGTATCTVVVSDLPIGSPLVDLPDSVVALNPPSMARYEPLLAPGGLLVVNDSLVEAEPARTDIEVVRLPCMCDVLNHTKNGSSASWASGHWSHGDRSSAGTPSARR